MGMADRTDEGCGHGRVDCVGGEGEDGAGGARLISFPFSFYFIRRTQPPRFAHSALMRATDFSCCGRRPVPFVFP